MKSGQRFWKWAHDQAERLWHWIYYAKLAPKHKPDGGSYQYSVFYCSKDGTLLEFDGTKHERIGEPISITPPK